MILFVAGIYMPRSSYFLCLPPIGKKLNSAASIAMPIPTPVYAYRFVRLLPRIHNTQDKSLTESKQPSWDTRSFEVAKSITITAKAPLRITQPTTQQIIVRYRRSTSIYVTYGLSCRMLPRACAQKSLKWVYCVSWSVELTCYLNTCTRNRIVPLLDKLHQINSTLAYLFFFGNTTSYTTHATMTSWDCLP